MLALVIAILQPIIAILGAIPGITLGAPQTILAFVNAPLGIWFDRLLHFVLAICGTIPSITLWAPNTVLTFVVAPFGIWLDRFLHFIFAILHATPSIMSITGTPKAMLALVIAFVYPILAALGAIPNITARAPHTMLALVFTSFDTLFDLVMALMVALEVTRSASLMASISSFETGANHL
jgi:hypothetical protein